MQDCRGTLTSEGDFPPFVDEPQDGADTIAWIADQPYSDGNVVMYGASYVGATQLLAATTGPAALRAIAPHLTASEYHEGWVYQGGAFQLGFVLSWSLGALGAASLVKRAAAGEDVGRSPTSSPPPTPRSMPVGFRAAAAADQPLLGTAGPGLRDWLGARSATRWRPRRSASVTGRSRSRRCTSAAGRTSSSRARCATSPASAPARRPRPPANGQRLLIGPWAHGNPHEVVGELDHGPWASQLALDMTVAPPRLLPAAVSGEAPPGAAGAPLRDGRQRRGATRTSGRSPGPAWSACTCAAAAPRTGRTATGACPRRRRPRTPPPTATSTTRATRCRPSAAPPCCPPPWSASTSGQRDQRAVERRADVLVYTSEPLDDDLEVTGTVVLHLVAASSAPDTDWTTKLVDVHQDGRALGVVDGILRARYREGLDRPRLLEPEQPTAFTVVVGSTSMLFRAGHRLRLEVSSSNFPRSRGTPTRVAT